MVRKVTFTLDDQTIRRLNNAAERTKKAQAEVDREIAEIRAARRGGGRRHPQ